MDDLLRLYHSGQTHTFLQQAHRALAAEPNAPDLAWLTLRTLVESGLGGPARELIEMRDDLQAAEADLGEVETIVSALPSGRVSWSGRRDVYERNAAVLLAGRGHLSEPLSSATGLLRGVHLYETKEGHFQISRRRAGCLREWFSSLCSLGEESKITLPNRGQIGPIAVTGVQHGNLIRDVYEKTHRVFLTLSHPIYLIEPDPIRFAAWLHCDDVSAWLGDQRVFVFVGDDAVGQFAQALIDEPDLPCPAQTLNMSGDPALAERVQSARLEVEKHRRAELDRLIAELEARYRDRDAAYWADRWRNPGTALSITSRFTTVLQYSNRDTMAALEALGYDTHTVLEREDHHALSPITVCHRLLDVDPDVFFIIDHLHYEHPHVPANLPFLTWVQDPLPNLLTRKAGESIGPTDFVFGYYRNRCIEEFGYPADRFYSQIVPVSTRVFYDGPVTGPDRKRFACDLMYAGNLQHTPASYHDYLCEENDPALHPLLKLIHQEATGLLKSGGHVHQTTAKPLVRPLVDRLGMKLSEDDLEHLATSALFRTFDLGYRLESIEWAAQWALKTGRTFKLYGKGWEDHPALAQFAQGPVEHGEPLRRAYRCARLSLQAIPSGYMHQRTFEAVGSGSLVLVRYSPNDFWNMTLEEFRDALAAGEEIRGASGRFPRLDRVTFRNAEEFEAMAESYLNDPDRYETTRREFHTAVMDGFTYRAVISDVISKVHQTLCGSLEPQAACCG